MAVDRKRLRQVREHFSIFTSFLVCLNFDLISIYVAWNEVEIFSALTSSRGTG